MDSTFAIEVDSLGKTYRSTLGRRQHEALRGVSFNVAPGQIFGLLGPNGAGKTTLLKVLLGIIRPSAGRGRILGEAIGSASSRRHVGYLPERLRVPLHHTADSALTFYGRLSGLSGRESRMRRGELLERVGLSAWERVRVGKLSKGMLQKLGLIAALLHDPQILILDEPTDGLDPVGRKQVRDILLAAREQGKTIFLNSHMLLELELICDQIAILNVGQLRFLGSLDAIRHRSESARLELELQGPETEARAALDMYGEACWAKLGEAHYRVDLTLADQLAVDQCIDGLRAGGISIVGLRHHTTSLEEAFLEIISSEPLDSEEKEEQK